MSRLPTSEPELAPPPAGQGQRPPASRARLAMALLEALPLLAPAMVAGYALVAMVALSVGQLRPGVVLPLGLLAAVAAARGVALARQEPLAGPRWLDGAALLLALGFAAFNAAYSAQDLSVFRDPAVYTLTGRWLVDHPSLPIPVQPAVFGDGGVSFSSGGFDPGPAKDAVYSQTSNLLPGLLATAGWLGGDHALLKLNPLIGGAALLACYGLLRQHAGRGWALAGVVALAVSLPQIHFSRDTYSEPVTMLFLLGGLALLREAQRRAIVPGYLLAGLVLGSAALARVDAFFFLLAVPIFAAAALAAARPVDRRSRARQVGALLVGVAVPAAVAMANLVRLSPDYFHNLTTELTMIAAAWAAVAVLGSAGVWFAWRTGLLRSLAASSRRWLPSAGAATVVVLAAVAASRPLWYVGHTPGAPESQTHYIEFLQRANGLPLDGTRSYAEQTMQWLSWYYGPVALGLGVLGTALLVHRLLRRGDLLLVAPLGMLLPAALLYLTVPSIVPDQVWAMRRYLPVVIPGMLLAGAVVLRLLARRSRMTAVLAGLLAATMVAVPAYVSAGVATVRPGRPLLAEVRNLCASLPGDAALLVSSQLQDAYQQTVRSWCAGVPVGGLTAEPTTAQLASLQAAARSHGRRLHVLVTRASAVPTSAPDPGWQPLSCIRAAHLSATLNQAAHSSGATPRTLRLGLVTPEGTVTPVPPTGSPLTLC